MKITIQVEDPRGSNISPMDEKTVTTDCDLSIDLWCEHIQVSEENSDADSEGSTASIFKLVEEFIELLDPTKPQPADIELLGRRAEETIGDMIRLQKVLRDSYVAVNAAIEQRRLLIVAADTKLNASIADDNAKYRLELNQKAKLKKPEGPNQKEEK